MRKIFELIQYDVKPIQLKVSKSKQDNLSCEIVEFWLEQNISETAGLT